MTVDQTPISTMQTPPQAAMRSLSRCDNRDAQPIRAAAILIEEGRREPGDALPHWPRIFPGL